MPKNFKNDPKAFIEWKAQRAAYARAKYHASKADPEYLEKKRASNRKTWRKRYLELRKDVEAYLWLQMRLAKRPQPRKRRKPPPESRNP